MKTWFSHFGSSVLMMLLAILCGCTDTSDTPFSDASIPERVALTDSRFIPEDNLLASTENSLGLLEAPHFNESLQILTERRIELSPSIVQTVSRGGRYYHPCVLDNDRFAVACLRGVDIFNLKSDSLKPEMQLDTLGEAWSVQRVGAAIWVADGYNGVVALEPDKGIEKAHWPELSNARSFHIMDDGRIVICRHSSGADLVESADGVSISHSEHLDIGSRIFSAASNGNRVFLGTLHGGYTAMEVEPGKPAHQLWSYPDCTRILWCDYMAGVHYLLDQDTGLIILADKGDVMPERLNTLQLAGQTRHGCFLDPTHLLVANQKELFLIDVTSADNPQILGHHPAMLEGRGVGVVGNRIIYSDSEYGIQILEWRKDALCETATYVHNGLAADVTMMGKDLALVAHTHMGVDFFELEQDRLRSIAYWEKCRYPVSVLSRDSLVMVVDYRGISFLEFQQSKPIRELSRLETPGRAVNLAIDGDYVYIADWFNGLQIVSIADLAHPVIVGNVPTDGWAIDVVVKDGFAYVCCVNQGLLTVDVHNSADPKVIGCDRSSQAPEAVITGNHCLYVADFNFGLIVYNLATPGLPVPTACHRMTVCKNVNLRDETLIVSNYVNGIKWFNVHEPLRPVLIGEMDTPGKCYGVAFIPGENGILVADWHDLLKVVW